MSADFRTPKRSRLLILFMAFACLWGVLLVRAAWIQLIPNSRLEALKRRQFETTVKLGHRRGDILDRNGHELAASSTAWSLFADPKILKEPKKIARDLAETLKPGAPLAEHKRVAKLIYAKIKPSSKRFVWVDRQLDTETKEIIEDKKIRGLGFIEEPKRIYPNEKLMSNVLGFVGQESRGLEGLELKLNSSLSGEAREIAFQRDARGRPLVVNGQLFSEAPEGASVQLTIDRELQFMVERELMQAVNEHEAASGTTIILDAQTSEILAMATLPTFNANDGIRAKPEARRNRTVTDLFEPGSTMKTFVVAAAIEAKKVDANTKIFAENGQMRIGKRIIREADAKHKFGWITTTEVLAYSSNIGASKIATLLGENELRIALERFGFGERTGSELPGEVRGVLHPLPWNDHLMANISFGHGIAVNALQVANAYASIANGGWLKRPYIVKSMVDPESGDVVEGKPRTIRRVLGDEAAAKMRLVLSAATMGDATGINARVPGFPVAGKTGTAQRVLENGRGYEAGAYVSSFAGFLPANDPKYVIFVSLDRPRKNYYGGAVAAPVFSRVARYAMSRAGIAPVLFNAKNIIPNDAAARARDPQADASTWRAQHGLKTEVERRKAEIAAQMRRSEQLAGLSPFGGIEMPKPYLDAVEKTEGTTVPDVVGLSLREAMEAFVHAGIPWQSVQANGQGFVAKQSPEPGRKWSQSKIYLQLTFSRSSRQNE